MEDRLQVYAGNSLILRAFGHDRARIVRALVPGLMCRRCLVGGICCSEASWLPRIPRGYARRGSRARARFVANRGAVVGAVLVAVLVGVAVLAPVLSEKNPLASDVEHGLSELGAPLPPSRDAVLGTDQLGRDVWARVVVATRASLSIAAIATLIALVIGVSIGLIAGYAG